MRCVFRLVKLMPQPSNESTAASAHVPQKAIVTVKSAAIIMGLLLVALTSLILLARCGKSREAARRELERKAIPYTEQEFVNRVRRRDLEITGLFLAAGMNPDAKDEEGSTVLMDAVLAGDSGIVEVLLSNGADANARATNNSTALHLAMLIGSNESARILVREGVDVNASNNEGETPLMIAALKGYPDNVKLLLDAGANLNVRDKRGETPLMHAVERNHTEVIELLKAAGAKE
jgi:ankyrin repeat protein